jgi:hypothetical protein
MSVTKSGFKTLTNLHRAARRIGNLEFAFHCLRGTRAALPLRTGALRKSIIVFQILERAIVSTISIPDHLAGRTPGPIREAACWAHGRRPFFAMADIEENARRKAAGKKEIALSPIAIEVVRRIDALFEIERTINGKSVEQRLVVRWTLNRPLTEDLHAYMREQLAKLSRGHDLAKAFNYILKRWASFTLF